MLYRSPLILNAFFRWIYVLLPEEEEEKQEHLGVQLGREHEPTPHLVSQYRGRKRQSMRLCTILLHVLCSHVPDLFIIEDLIENRRVCPSGYADGKRV